MLDAYDKVIKAHLESFLKVGDREIKVYGLQNEDDSGDSIFSQAGAGKDKIEFPFVTAVRLPQVIITDHAMTKRPSNYSGYFLINEPGKQVNLNCMRCDLAYAFDVYGENKKITEDIGTQLYFRLRNNNELKVQIVLPVRNMHGEIESATCVCDIVMKDTMTHMRLQGNDSAQIYKFRIEATLKNVNIYDITEKEMYKFNYFVTARLAED